jgi:hypothetical protein
MKRWMVGAAIFSLAQVVSLGAQEEYDYGRVRFTEPSVILQRAAEAETEEAAINAPLLPGDRLWTDGSGRLEAQYEDGSMLWVAQRTKLDYASQQGSDEGDETVLRLWAGRLALRARGQSGTGFVIETPVASVSATRAAFLRLDVDPQTTRVTLVEGQATLETASHRVSLDPGTTTVISSGGEDLEIRATDRWQDDDFVAWVEQRDDQDAAWASANQGYLPAELQPYAAELDSNGTWYYEPEVGHVWHPHVDDDWQPYSSGRWVWTYYGWTWVPYEPWGWAPSHFGTWDYSFAIGWYWVPGRVWGPAWVSWSIGPRHVGWCPLNRRHRPVVIARGDRDRYRQPRGYATRRGVDPWVSVAKDDFRRSDVGRHRTPQGNAQRIADAVNEQPARNLLAFTERPNPPAVAAEIRARNTKAPGIFERRARTRQAPIANRPASGAPAIEQRQARPAQKAPARSIFERQESPAPQARERQATETIERDAPDRKNAAPAPSAAGRHSGGNVVRELFRSIGREDAEPRDADRDSAPNAEKRSSGPRPVESAVRAERESSSSSPKAAPRSAPTSGSKPAADAGKQSHSAPRAAKPSGAKKGQANPKKSDAATKRRAR